MHLGPVYIFLKADNSELKPESCEERAKVHAVKRENISAS